MMVSLLYRYRTQPGLHADLGAVCGGIEIGRLIQPRVHLAGSGSYPRSGSVNPSPMRTRSGNALGDGNVNCSRASLQVQQGNAARAA
ncbi:MAG: hypothetical protein MZV64_23985 [Ignavibacteriales bacterium]|nr:hypothetical protein [Ignavibacteriales bacterium]